MAVRANCFVLQWMLITIWICFQLNVCNDACTDSESCDSNSDIESTGYRLTTMNTFVGEVKEITLQSKPYQLKTLSVNPLAFEIANYLTDIECNAIINAAVTKGLRSSITSRNKQTTGYQIFDIDNDNHLDLSEMRITLEQNHDINMNDDDIIEMYDFLEVDTNHDTKLSRNELNAFNPNMLHNYVDNVLLVEKPFKHSRVSRQSWLYYPDDYNDIITNIHHRLYDLFDTEIFNVPQYIVNDSYTLQVVHYTAGGKYNAHFDSTFRKSGKDLPCCFMLSKDYRDACKSCRFMTVLYYLNDCDEGGSTAFPLSNQENINKQFNKAAIMSEEELDNNQDGIQKHNSIKWRMSANNLPEVYCNENEDNVQCKATKGKALIWFNHLVENDWLGECDLYSMHTGCPIKKGEKWIANHWILVNDKKPKQS